MAMTAQTYGLVPVYHPSGQSRANRYAIASGYAANIFKGDPVVLNTNGTIQISAGNDDIIGVFAGCEYTAANGRRVVSPYWPSGTTATDIVAFVYDDPQNVFRIGTSANATGYTQAVIGDQANTTIGTGNTITGISAASIATAAVGAGTQGQLRVVGFFDGPYNATDNPFPQLLVQIARHQFVGNKTAI